MVSAPTTSPATTMLAVSGPEVKTPLLLLKIPPAILAQSVSLAPAQMLVLPVITAVSIPGSIATLLLAYTVPHVFVMA